MRTDSPERRCDKPNCGNPAAASFSFRYDTGELWIGDLADPDPSRYDLCHDHAEQLTAPRGWERIDERSGTVERLPYAGAAESGWGQVAVGGGSVSSGNGAAGAGRPGNRYAGLSADLPRLAAEVQASEEAGHDAHDTSEPGAPPITSRELSPMPADAPGTGGVVLDFDRSRERRGATGEDPGAESAPATGEDPGDEDDPGPAPDGGPPRDPGPG